MNQILILVIILAVFAVFAVISYNSLIAAKNKVEEAKSDIDVQLKRRYDLIPNLIETVKGAGNYESETLEKVIKARQQVVGITNLDSNQATTSSNFFINYVFNRIINFACKTTLLLLILLSVFSIQAKVAADANQPIKNDALLTINYNKDVSITEFRDNLQMDLKNENAVLVSTLSSKLTIGNKTQTFSLSNEADTTNKFIRNYTKQVKAILPTMVSLKENKKVEEATKAVLNKFSTSTLKASVKRNENITITAATIGGSLRNIQVLQKGLTSKNSTLTFVNIKDIEVQVKKIQTEIDKAKTREEKMLIANKEITKIAGQIQVPAAVNVNLTEIQIKEIDKTMVKDLNSNIYPSVTTLNMLGLNEIEKSKIDKMIEEFNKVPEEIKDGSMQALDAVNETTTQQSEVGKQYSILEKIGIALTIDIKGKAWCDSRSWVNRHWWGSSTHLNECSLQRINAAGGGITAILTILSISFCPIACGIIAAGIAAALTYINWINAECGGNGVSYNRTWANNWWIWKIC